MEKEEFQKKYNDSFIHCVNEAQVNEVFSICNFMGLTYYKSAKRLGVIIGVMKVKSPLFHVEQFVNDFHTGIKEDKKEESIFQKGTRIMYTIEDSNGNTYAVTRLSERVYESKEHNTLFVTSEEGVVTGVYKEK